MMRRFLPRTERIRREAADWFARLHGPGGAGLAGEARRWAERDPAHAEALDRLDRHWRAAAALEPGPVEMAFPARDHAPSRLALAAGVAAVLGLSAIVATSGLPPFAQAGRAQLLSFETATGQIRKVGFGDGLLLTLDTQSTASVGADRGRRSLRLERGRVRIEARKGRWPMLLLAGRRIDLIGAGQLDAAAGPGGPALAAIRGRLSFRLDGGAEQRLEPGQRLFVGQGRAGPSSGPVSPLDAQWASGSFEFESAPLGEVVALANRYSDSRLVLADSSLAAERVTGRFRAGDIDGLAASVAAALDLKVGSGPGRQVRLGRNRMSQS
jgi:transmembrane sensor